MDAYSFLLNELNNEQFTVGEFVSSCLSYIVGTSSEYYKYLFMKGKDLQIIIIQAYDMTMDGCFEWCKKRSHAIFLGLVRGGFGWSVHTCVQGRGKHSPNTRNASISRL